MGTAAAVDPADAEAAAAYAAAVDSGRDIEVMPNLDDYTTWEPNTWSEVDYDKIPFPTDPMQGICSVLSCMRWQGYCGTVTTSTSVPSTRVRGIALMPLGRPPFTPNLPLVHWRNGLKTDPTASAWTSLNG